MAPIRLKLSLVWFILQWFILQERPKIPFFNIIMLILHCGLDWLTKRRQERVHQLENERSEPEEIAANLNERELYEAPEFGTTSGQMSKLANLQMMVAGIMSKDPQQQTECTAQFFRLLSKDENPPIQQIIEAGVMPRLVIFLLRDDIPALQLAAAGALANIASSTSEHTALVIESGAKPIFFVRLLRSPHDDVREQAVLALGYIARNSPTYRDLILQSGAMQPLLQQLNQNSRLRLLKYAIRTLSIIYFVDRPWPDFIMIRNALLRLALLTFSSDEEVLTYACCALRDFSEKLMQPEQNQAVIEAGVCRRLVDLFLHPSPDVQHATLRTVYISFGNGNDLQKQLILDSNPLPSILALLSSPDEEILVEACRIIDGICEMDVQSVIDNNIIPPLIQLLTNGDIDVREKASWAIKTAASRGTPEQIKFMVQQGCIRPLCDFLADSSNAESYKIALGVIENILKVGQHEMMLTGQPNQMATLIAEAKGLKTLEMLAKHENSDSEEEDEDDYISEICIRILETYFGVNYIFQLISLNFSPDALRRVLS